MPAYICAGEMAERSNAAVLKTVDCNRSGGSNPSLSAIAHQSFSRWAFCNPVWRELHNKNLDQRFLIGCSFLKIQLVDGSRSLIPLIKRTDFEMMSLVSSCQHFIYARLIIAGLLPNIRINLKCDTTALRNEGMQL